MSSGDYTHTLRSDRHIVGQASNDGAGRCMISGLGEHGVTPVKLCLQADCRLIGLCLVIYASRLRLIMPNSIYSMLEDLYRASAARASLQK